MNYAEHFSTKQTPQSEPIPGSNQARNSAGGYCFVVDDWSRLDRFLILGAEGGTYYAGERELTQNNAQAVLRCIQQNGAEVVRRIVAVSRAGRAPKNDPAVFALALAASFGESIVRRTAYEALPSVCRIGTHLFSFAAACDAMRGWGGGLRRAVGRWYLEKDPADLAYQVIKYQQRNGWSHRDLLRLSHPKASGLTNDVLHWAVKGWPDVGEGPHPEPALRQIWAFERAKRANSEGEIVSLILEHRLPRECVPTQWLESAAVWDALLADMPLTAMIRNLGKMTAVGLVTPHSLAARKVCLALSDSQRLKRARIHPLNVLVALKTYAQGHGEKGGLNWTPAPEVSAALDAAFHHSFAAVEPTGLRWMLGVDVSSSMSAKIAGLPLSCCEAAAALAMTALRSEKDCIALAFSTQLVPFPARKDDRLDQVLAATRNMNFDNTDCSLPMLHALERRLPIDVFYVLTDSETWAWRVHPSQALRQYRQQMGIDASLVVLAMTASNFTIADPNDAGMLDVCGLDLAVPEVVNAFARPR